MFVRFRKWPAFPRKNCQPSVRVTGPQAFFSRPMSNLPNLCGDLPNLPTYVQTYPVCMEAYPTYAATYPTYMETYSTYMETYPTYTETYSTYMETYPTYLETYSTYIAIKLNLLPFPVVRSARFKGQDEGKNNSASDGHLWMCHVTPPLCAIRTAAPALLSVLTWPGNIFNYSLLSRETITLNFYQKVLDAIRDRLDVTTLQGDPWRVNHPAIVSLVACPIVSRDREENIRQSEIGPGQPENLRVPSRHHSEQLFPRKYSAHRQLGSDRPGNLGVSFHHHSEQVGPRRPMANPLWWPSKELIPAATSGIGQTEIFTALPIGK
ncbi:hypothetical protein DFH07DRAFT_770488 [Mycena maculata]|uniref:Uncharacterized protein n=1 Tax=Mycena maculata TaxID=230809 RepID=A0AAD7NJM0_9AGAR|nr:hypothetical protein DFH07DRAFT_770488 [Mycena maculata]